MFVLLAAVVLTGCGTLPGQYSAAPTRSLIKGVSTANSAVKIRSIDGGDVIYARGINLGDKVWLEPGIHKVDVVCESKHSWGSHFQTVQVEIDVQPGYDYFVSTDPVSSPPSELLKSSAKKAVVHVAPVARKR